MLEGNGHDLFSDEKNPRVLLMISLNITHMI